MLRIMAISATLLITLVSNANAMDCGKAFKSIVEAINVNQQANKIGLVRGAVHTYDLCMAGDKENAKHAHKMLVEQMQRGLGANNTK